MATLSRTQLASSRVEKRAGLRSIDLTLALSATLLVVVGLASLYSEGIGKAAGGMFRKQLLNLAIGAIPFAVFYIVRPTFWRKAAPALYVLNLAMLGATLFAGERRGGAQRWIDLGPFQFQPSEFAKLFLIFTLAAFLAARKGQMNRVSTYTLSLLHVGVPAALIFLQPHLGATLVVMVIWLTVTLIGGIPMRTILATIGAAVLALAFAFTVPGVIKDYQKDRIRGLMYGHLDEQDKGYQTSRAQIAFANGGVMGAGYLNGVQKRGRYIPEQHTDFIFTVVGEEGGLIGASLVLGLFGVFFYRVWKVMVAAMEPFERMVVAGVYGMLAFHTFVNVGMLLGLVPVVGLWLPFMSYGGTALWLCMACVGLLLNIRRRQRPVLF